MTNRDILNIAAQQSAIDSGCDARDFFSGENKVVLSREDERARKYLKLPFLCDFTSYGGGIVASVSPELAEIAAEYIRSYPAEHCFETPNLHVLNEAFAKHDMMVCFMAEYFLPDVNALTKGDCRYEMRLLENSDFHELYRPEWQNALSEGRKELDVLGVGAYDNDGHLIGLAACSADCDSMWQIGIDVLPQYRRQGIASALTGTLALEILERGKVPFYCCAWSNIRSARNAIRSGFRPAWAELTVKPKEFVERMNR